MEELFFKLRQEFEKELHTKSMANCTGGEALRTLDIAICKLRLKELRKQDRKGGAE